jgi:hypothetical protein
MCLSSRLWGELPLVCPKTINRILHKHQRIAKPKVPEHTPLVRAGPMMEWEIDFKDVVTVGRRRLTSGCTRWKR